MPYTAPVLQAGGAALSSAIAVAAAATASGDTAPARLLTEHLEAAAAAGLLPALGLGSELESNAHTSPDAGGSAHAVRPEGAEASAAGGSQGLVPAGDRAAQCAEAVQRLFELRLALGQPEEAAAGVLAATGAMQRVGSYEARLKSVCQACKTRMAIPTDRCCMQTQTVQLKLNRQGREICSVLLWNEIARSAAVPCSP